MDNNFKYDPEDIESLLMHKQFNELYDEEKEFILQHVESEEEYDSLRKTLFELHEYDAHQELLEPDASIKVALMREFASEKKGRFMIWLNSLFSMPEIVWYRRPAFKLAFATACISGLALFFVFNRSDISTIADATGEKSNLSVDSINEKPNLFADNLTTSVYPPAPKELVVVAESQLDTEESPMDLYPSEMDIQRDMVELKDVPGITSEESKTVVVADKSISAVEIAESNSAVPAFSKTTEMENEKLVKSNRSEMSKKELDNVAISNVPDLSEQMVTTAGAVSYDVSTGSSQATYSVLESISANSNTLSWTPPLPVSSVAMSEMKDLFKILYTAP